MNNKIIIALLLSFLFINISCEYEPKGVFERDVTKNTAATEINISEFTLDTDTLYWYNNDQNIRLIFNLTNGTANKINIYVNDKLKLEFEKASAINFNPALGDGMHKLKVEILTSSGNGSIADGLGLEGNSFFKDFIIIVNKNFKPNPIASVSNGYLKISLDKYLGSDLLEYQIQKQDFDSKTITTKNNIFIDSVYVGEGMGFRFFVKNKKNEIIPWGELLLKTDLPKLNLNKTGSNTYIAAWSKTNYYNAASNYEIYRSNFPDGISNGFKNSQLVNDTTYSIKDGYFGDNLTIGIKVIPKNSNLQRHFSLPIVVKNTLIGFDIKEIYVDHFIDLIKINNDQFIYTVYTGSSSSRDTLYKFSMTQKSIVERKRFINCEYCQISGISVSGDGENMLLKENGKYIFAKTNDLNNFKIFDLSNYTGIYYSPYVPIANNDNLLINNNSGSQILNIKSNSLSDQYSHNITYEYKLKISPNGQYFVTTNSNYFTVVQYDGNNFKEMFNFQGSLYGKFYDFDSNNNFVYFSDGYFVVRNPQVFGNVVYYQLNDQYILDIDYVNNEMLTYSTGQLKIRKYPTGEIIKVIPINFSPFNENSCILINGNIVTRKGLILFKE